MDLYDATTMAHDLMDEHGLAAKGWTLDWMRAVRTLGQCRYDRRQIRLSRSYVLANAPEKVRNTILHEIAHALAGPAAGHGLMWKLTARRIGCDARRCSTNHVPIEAPWHVRCTSCGKVALQRHRRPTKWADPRYRSRCCAAPLSIEKNAAVA